MYTNQNNPFKKSRSAFEIIVVVGIIATFAIIAASVLGSACVSQRGPAEAEASAWARDMGFSTPHISCADRDTDNDGYVSCTVSTKNDKGDVQLHAVECASKWSLNSGCRAPKFNVKQFTQ